jgi:hypothetical protein
MATGGYNFTAATAAQGRAAKDYYKRQRIEQFAEALSEIGDISATCKYLGLARSTGTLYMKAITDRLGWQAR